MTTPVSEILAQFIRSIDRAETVNLTPGQIISLLVKQIEGSQALLTYQGRLLMAQMETPLTPGERIRCMVEGERDGRVLLKLLTEGGQQPENAGSRAIDMLLKEMGLPTAGKNQIIVQELLRQELPATKDNIQALGQLAQKTAANPDDTDVLVFVHKQDIPVTAKSFELIRAAFKEKDFLNTPVENLRQQITALVRDLPADSEIRALAEKINILLDKITIKQGEIPGQIQARLAEVPRLLGLPTIPLISDMSTGKNGYAALQEIANRLPPELKQQFMDVLMPALKEALTQDAVINKNPANNEAVASNIAALRDNVMGEEIAAAKNGTPLQESLPEKDRVTVRDGVPAKDSVKDGAPVKDGIPLKDGVPGKDGVPVKDGIPVKEGAPMKDGVLSKDGVPAKEGVPLKDGISPKDTAGLKDAGTPKDNALLREALFSKDVTASKGAAFTEEGDTLPVLLNKLQGLIKGESTQEKALQSIINTVQERLNTLETLQRPAAANQEGLFMLQSAFQAGEKKYPLEMLVKYRKEKNGQTIDYSRCHLYVTLATASLGTVQAAVQLSSKNLNCRFTADNETARQDIEKWLPDLTQKLALLGYNVNMLASLVRVNNPSPVLAPVTDRPGIYQVDIIV